jgi:hypothetical protein
VDRHLAEGLAGQEVAENDPVGGDDAAGHHHGPQVEAPHLLADRGVSAHIDDSRWQAIIDRFVANVRAVNPTARLIHLSARTGEGVDEWCDWLLGVRRDA